MRKPLVIVWQSSQERLHAIPKFRVRVGGIRPPLVGCTFLMKGRTGERATFRQLYNRGRGENGGMLRGKLLAELVKAPEALVGSCEHGKELPTSSSSRLSEFDFKTRLDVLIWYEH
jgi:hypothetical protein